MNKGHTKTNPYNFYMFYKTFQEIFHTASGKFDARLSWTHYRILLQVKDTEARNWYATAVYQRDKLEFIKNPVVAEFLGLAEDSSFTENDLESSILSNLQKFIMELGKGYAFVAR